jgi:hypothetical protein
MISPFNLSTNGTREELLIRSIVPALRFQKALVMPSLVALNRVVLIDAA